MIGKKSWILLVVLVAVSCGGVMVTDGDRKLVNQSKLAAGKIYHETDESGTKAIAHDIIANSATLEQSFGPVVDPDYDPTYTPKQSEIARKESLKSHNVWEDSWLLKGIGYISKVLPYGEYISFISLLLYSGMGWITARKNNKGVEANVAGVEKLKAAGLINTKKTVKNNDGDDVPLYKKILKDEQTKLKVRGITEKLLSKVRSDKTRGILQSLLNIFLKK